MAEQFDKIFPYGTCDCSGFGGRGDGCCHGKGPSAYRVEREGREMKVCTKCILSSDEEKAVLVKLTDSFELYVDFDSFGALVLATQVKDKDGE